MTKRKMFAHKTIKIDEAFNKAVKNSRDAMGASLNAPNMMFKGVELKFDKSVADRDNDGKVQLSFWLDFPHTANAVARVFEMGAKKYSRDNWKKGLKEDELLDAAMRHILSHVHNSNNRYDKESGQMHLAHAIWNLAVIIEQTYGVHNYES